MCVVFVINVCHVSVKTFAHVDEAAPLYFELEVDNISHLRYKVRILDYEVVILCNIPSSLLSFHGFHPRC